MNFARRLASKLNWYEAHARLERVSHWYLCSNNGQLQISDPFHARVLSTEPRRRGPPSVTEEAPVDTTKYSDVLIKLNGYDPAVLTSFYHFVDQAARNMKFDVLKKFNLATEAFSVTLANPPHFFREKNMRYNFKNHGRMIQHHGFKCNLEKTRKREFSKTVKIARVRRTSAI